MKKLNLSGHLTGCIKIGGNKSDVFISNNQPGLQRSDPIKSSHGSHSLLVSNSIDITVYSCFFLTFLLSVSLTLLCLIASASQYPSQTHNCARLLKVATQSSRLNCQSRLVK